MRIRAPQSRRSINQITLNLTSMIDVIFLLLIYFMITMVINAPEDRLSSTIRTKRESEAGSLNDFQPQIVSVERIDGRPGFRLGSRVFFDRAGLVAALEPLSKEAGVFINVYGDVSVTLVAAAFQAANDAGFEKVTYVPIE